MNTQQILELEKNTSLSILDSVDAIRIVSNSLLDSGTRGRKGQFMTSNYSCRILANMFENLDGNLTVLDAGAGVGSLTSALVERSLLEFQPEIINSYTWEIEDLLIGPLKSSLSLCNDACAESNTRWHSEIYHTDFIQSAIDILKLREKGLPTPTFNKAILNPPYLKIAAKSKERELLRSVGVETGNLYSCFITLALMLLEDGGELVAITPRSFCNGPYFNDYRRVLLEGNNLSKIHIFESRKSAFKTDKVLQENVIFRIVKNRAQGNVEIVSSTCENDPTPLIRVVEFDEVVNPANPDKFIHIVTSEEQATIANKISGLPCSLSDLGVEVSTGKVVDFRNKPHLRHDPDQTTVPLIFPMHFRNGKIQYPVQSNKKPNAIHLNEETVKMMVPNGTYLLTKRLTSKEETRRVVAGLYTPELTSTDVVGFENKTNYFHANGSSLDINLAKGLWVYLNSTIVDQYFRQFNGHTQVNATDLRVLRYPSKSKLIEIGRQVDCYDQELFDNLVLNL